MVRPRHRRSQRVLSSRLSVWSAGVRRMAGELFAVRPHGDGPINEARHVRVWIAGQRLAARALGGGGGDRGGLLVAAQSLSRWIADGQCMVGVHREGKVSALQRVVRVTGARFASGAGSGDRASAAHDGSFRSRPVGASRHGLWRVRGLLCAGALWASSAIAAPLEFATVTPAHPVELPRDTGAHPAFRTEWWYATGWLTTPDHQPLGFQITFFRSATGHDADDPSSFAPSQLIIAHAALSDPAIGHLAHDQRIARQGFGLADARPGNTDIKLDAWKMIRAADGHYDVTVDANGFALHLTLTPTQAALIQGERGYSRKGPRPEQASYYYSEPQLRVTGSVVRPLVTGSTAVDTTVVTGVAWLDHEWSSTLLDPNAVGWDWLGANLADGSALMAFRIRARDGRTIWAHAALRDPAGRLTAFDDGDVAFTPIRDWRSPRTNASYPVAMRVKTGTLTWLLDPLMDDQELDSRQSTGAVYWEGAVRVKRAGVDVGRAYLELTGYADTLRLGKR